MRTFRVEVGHAHGVKPGNIVGAIANEAGLDSKYIGRIEIFDDYSVLDLPDSMPKELLAHLKTVWVAGQQLRISYAGEIPTGDKNLLTKSPLSAPKKGAIDGWVKRNWVRRLRLKAKKVTLSIARTDATKSKPAPPQGTLYSRISSSRSRHLSVVRHQNENISADFVGSLKTRSRLFTW